MKALPACVMALWAVTVLAPPVSADTFVRTESHTDSYYRGGMVFPAEDSERETWIGDDRLATVTEGRRVVVDRGRGILLFVNRAESTYVEAPLPVDFATLFSEEENARLTIFKRKGTVAPRDETREVAGRPCSSYAINDWMDYEDSRLSERDIVVWATTDVPFDWKAVAEMTVELERIGNFGEEYIASRRAIEGFPVLAEETSYTEGIRIPTTVTVTELEEREPPEGIYAVPEGFTKKDRLTLQDLRS